MLTMLRGPSCRSRQRGFTYLMLLWWVAIQGVLLMALSQRWSMEVQRQREAELLWRGLQIRAAIEAYSKVQVNEGASRFPQRLQDLTQDLRSGRTVRHLREVWPDPMSNGPWVLIQDAGGGVRGVRSASERLSLRRDLGERHSDSAFEVESAAPPLQQGASLH